MAVALRRHGPLIGVQRRLAELGRLRFGEVVHPSDPKKKPYPRSLTKWRLTSASKDLLEAAAEIYGGKVRAWKDAPDDGMFELLSDSAELDVLLPPVYSAEDGTPTYPYSQSFELWDGPTYARRCDGETAVVPKGRGLEEKPCLCDPENRACSVVTRVTVMLPRLPGIGVWRMDSRGWTVATQLPGTLDLLSRAAAQRRFVPAVLRLEQRSKKRRGEDGKVTTNRFVVPVLDLGLTPGELVSAIGGDTWNVPALPPAERPQLTGGPEPAEGGHQRPSPEWGEEIPVEPIEQPVVGGPVEAPDPAPAGPAAGDTWMRALHATARERGLDHDGIKRVAATVFDWAEPTERSLNDLNPLERGQLRQAIEALPIESGASPGTGPSEGSASQEELPVPPGESAAPATPLPSEDTLDAVWEAAVDAGKVDRESQDWGPIYAIARDAFPGRDPDDLDDIDWQAIRAVIAGDKPQGRPRSAS